MVTLLFCVASTFFAETHTHNLFSIRWTSCATTTTAKKWLLQNEFHFFVCVWCRRRCLVASRTTGWFFQRYATNVHPLPLLWSRCPTNEVCVIHTKGLRILRGKWNPEFLTDKGANFSLSWSRWKVHKRLSMWLYKGTETHILEYQNRNLYCLHSDWKLKSQECRLQCSSEKNHR